MSFARNVTPRYTLSHRSVPDGFERLYYKLHYNMLTVRFWYNHSVIDSNRRRASMCVFCKIVAGEIPSNKVLENDEFVAFHDINPIAPVHILVIPKVHVENFQSVSGELMAKMTPFIQSVAKELCLDQTGYRLIVNNGKDGGQEVPHLHFHLLGGARLKWTHLAKDETHKSL